jgi:hypothetical protein
MIREHVVITQVNITNAGQVKHFQVKLPKNAKRIIGVELGGRLLQRTDRPISDAMPAPYAEHSAAYSVSASGASAGAETSAPTYFKRNKLIGEVKLQSCEEANIFYAGHLQTDENIGYGDFTQNNFWMPSAFSHQAQSLEERVVVDGNSTIIQGIYRDRIGEQSKVSYSYLVNIYVWIEIEEPNIKD